MPEPAQYGPSKLDLLFGVHGCSDAPLAEQIAAAYQQRMVALHEGAHAAQFDIHDEWQRVAAELTPGVRQRWLAHFALLVPVLTALCGGFTVTMIAAMILPRVF